MAENFHWPGDDEIHVLHLEGEPLPKSQQRAALPSGEQPSVPAVGTSVAAPPAQLTKRAVADQRTDRNVTEDVRRAITKSDASGKRHLFKGTDWRRHAGRWAVPVLAAVVAIESGLLLRDVRREPVPATAVTRQPSGPNSGSTTPSSPALGDTGHAGLRPDLPPLQGPTAPSTNDASGAAVGGAVAAPGAVSIVLPFQVEVYDANRLVGIAGGEGLPLSAGTHNLELVNESLGYRVSQRVQVLSGRTTRLTPILPTRMLQLNATPWAEVIIDGQSYGETPLGNVQVPIGAHKIVFRHPQLGEQTRTIVVDTRSTIRLGVDLRTN